MECWGRIVLPENAASWMDVMFSRHAALFLKFSEARTDVPDALKFLESLCASKPDKVVDLACGGGRLTAGLATWADNVVAVDLSDEFLSHARRRLTAFDNVTVVKADMMTPELDPLVAGSDLIVRLYTSLGYFSLERELDFISRCARALGPGGVLVLDTISSSAIARRGPIFREIRVDGLILREAYVLNDNHGVIDSAWSYEGDAQPVLIPFSLATTDFRVIEGHMGDLGMSLEIYDGFSQTRLEGETNFESGIRITLVGRKL